MDTSFFLSKRIGMKIKVLNFSHSIKKYERGCVMGTIEAICISDKKGEPKKAVLEAELVEAVGIVGDAHAGMATRQVSLLAGESIDRMKTKIPSLSDGAFAENIITRGVSLDRVKLGDRLQIGSSILLEVTQIGKTCHNACQIQKITGECIMPREGIFTRVLSGGKVVKGDKVGIRT
jgi:MOSC domain-containing protein YiiM